MSERPSRGSVGGTASKQSSTGGRGGGRGSGGARSGTNEERSVIHTISIVFYITLWTIINAPPTWQFLGRHVAPERDKMLPELAFLYSTNPNECALYHTNMHTIANNYMKHNTQIAYYQILQQQKST